MSAPAVEAPKPADGEQLAPQKGQLQDPDTVTKYKVAAEITNKVLAHVKTLCVADASVLSICEAGDRMIVEECGKVYKKKAHTEGGKDQDVPKGISFPTCISVNNVVCHYSPVTLDQAITLRDGDLIKIDLGCHVDGYAAVVASSIVIGASSANPITDRRADVVLAAHYATEAVLRMLKPGTKFTEISDTILKVAEAYKVKPIEGMLCHTLTHNVIDGEKAIIVGNLPGSTEKPKDHSVEVNDVYAIDVMISSAEGKVQGAPLRTTVWKRVEDTNYMMKMKVSRALLSEVKQKFPTFPFTLRAMEDEKRALLGLGECHKHKLLDPFPVVLDADNNAVVAEVKYTVLVGANGTVRITDALTDLSVFKSDKSIVDEGVKALLAADIPGKKKNKKKPAKKEAGTAAE
eukprot:comp9880_c0_seq1/m.4818 comp9880_c0_seq1/g.4818  ORF comp9880_c0_seq1/g.4818 comp9880_c0_seq1/m.4818 type:complete len:404 (-) comp9880_c0_seq1:136-1347(-)